MIPVPAFYHTSQEAQSESNYEFDVGDPNSRADKYVRTVINFNHDILYVNHFSNETMSYSTFYVEYLNYMVYVYRASMGWFCHLSSPRRLAFGLGAMRNLSMGLWQSILAKVKGDGWSDEKLSSPWILLTKLCPALEELIFLIRGGPLGATLEDWYEVNGGQGNAVIQQEMDYVSLKFRDMQKRGKWEKTRLVFMRFETSAR